VVFGVWADFIIELFSFYGGRFLGKVIMLAEEPFDVSVQRLKKDKLYLKLLSGGR